MGKGGLQISLVLVITLLSNEVSTIPLDEFYLFGGNAGDSLLDRNDDDTSPEIVLNPGFNFFGRAFTSIFVSSACQYTINDKGERANIIVQRVQFFCIILKLFPRHPYTSRMCA